MTEIKKILLSKEGKVFYVRDITNDFHCQFGFVKKSALKKSHGIVKTNTKKELQILTPSFIDIYKKIKRAPQIIPRKDIGIIIVETGINKESKILDAGAGSGALCCALANIAKQVTTYELREDFAKIVNSNIKLLDLQNIKLKNKDITKGITERNLDLITLDLPSPWLAIPHALKALKNGGFIVSYSPTTPQVSDFIEEVNKHKELVYLKTVEISERHWEFEGRKIRPKSQQIGHSGFITFVRKV